MSSSISTKVSLTRSVPELLGEVLERVRSIERQIAETADRKNIGGFIGIKKPERMVEEGPADPSMKVLFQILRKVGDVRNERERLQNLFESGSAFNEGELENWTVLSS
jgi:hypothetical protein